MRTFDSPVERLSEVTLGLLGHKSFTNILLGIFIGSAVQTISPDDIWWVGLSGVIWVFSVISYSIADEVKQAYEEKKNRLLEPSDTRPKGIE